MNLNSKYFDRIRIRPQEEPVAEDAPACQWVGCANAGTYRAPKGRQHEGEYYCFCLDHVKEYNKSYNYFAGMPDADVTAYARDAATGHRPTWAMGARQATPSEGATRSWGDAFRDMFARFGAKPEPKEERRPLLPLERRSFATLDLEGGETRAEIKARFKMLVKRLHPDANGGDRSSEERLREIIQAYNHLKAAGFC